MLTTKSNLIISINDKIMKIFKPKEVNKKDGRIRRFSTDVRRKFKIT